MNPNESNLRKGTYHQRQNKCMRRVASMDMHRANGMTWAEIGKKYGVSRQAAHKFYTENKYMITSKL